MTVQIHGKAYVTCAERLQMAMESGKAIEMIESAPLPAGDRWIWRCIIKIDERQYIGSAEVHLNAKPGSADATDPWACGETSAMARALGWAGFGVLEGIASADEIVRVQPASNGNAQSDALTELIGKAKTRAKTLGLATDKATWEAFLQETIGEPLTDKDLTLALVARVNGRITAIERERGVAAK